MTRPFLFGASSGSQSQNKYLVEFRAGKMSMKGKMVIPDKRKGLVYINQTEDSLMHFCWKDRKTGNVEDDLIIFPDDAEFKKVPQCTTGRVFILKFKSSSRKSFYWMQEPKADKDEELCAKVNEYLNNPPPVRGGAGGGGAPSSQGGLDYSSLAEGEIHNIINNMSQQQLVQLLAGQMGVNISSANLSGLLNRPPCSNISSDRSGSLPSVATTTTAAASTTPAAVTTQPATTTVASSTPITTGSTPATRAASEPTTTAPAASIQLAELQNILSGLNVPAGSTATSAASNQPPVDLNNAVTLEALQPLIDNGPLMERLRSLLPPAQEVEASEQLRSTVQSPQFQQAMTMFSQALHSGQLGPLMQQFGMAPEVIAAANSGDMDAFVKALQASLKQQQESKKKDDEEDMNLD